jgi:hypothetical protein
MKKLLALAAPFALLLACGKDPHPAPPGVEGASYPTPNGPGLAAINAAGYYAAAAYSCDSGTYGIIWDGGYPVGCGVVAASDAGGGGGSTTPTTFVGSYYSFPLPDAGYQLAQATNGTYGSGLFIDDGTQWRPSFSTWLGYAPASVDAGSWTHLGTSGSASTLTDQAGQLILTGNGSTDGFWLNGLTLSATFQLDVEFQVDWPVFCSGNGMFGVFMMAATTPTNTSPGKRFAIYNNSNTNLVLQVQQFGSGYSGGAGSVSYTNSLATWANNVTPLHLRLSSNGTTLSYYFCSNSVDCFSPYNEALSTLVTPTTIAILTNTTGCSYTARLLSWHVCNGTVCP